MFTALLAIIAVSCIGAIAFTIQSDHYWTLGFRFRPNETRAILERRRVVLFIGLATAAWAVYRTGI